VLHDVVERLDNVVEWLDNVVEWLDNAVEWARQRRPRFAAASNVSKTLELLSIFLGLREI